MAALSLQVRRPARGFSLIELMVVLAIVGILTGGASLAIDSIRANDTDDAVERLRRTLEASAERAAVRGRPVMVEFIGDSYRFAELDTRGRWQALDAPPVFVYRTLPEDLHVTSLRRYGAAGLPQRNTAAADHGVNTERLVFGTNAPRFELGLTDARGAIRLVGDPFGRVNRQTPGPSAR